MRTDSHTVQLQVQNSTVNQIQGKIIRLSIKIFVSFFQKKKNGKK